jgi:hypothetical protein
MIINFRNSETSRIQKINLDAYKLTRTPMIKKKKKKTSICLPNYSSCVFISLHLLEKSYLTVLNSFEILIVQIHFHQ